MTTLRSVRRRLRQFFLTTLRLSQMPSDIFNVEQDLNDFFAGRMRLWWNPYLKCLVCEKGEFN